MTRRAFKTAEQLAASEAARWGMAHSKLGWHDRRPTAKHSSKLYTKPLPRAANPVESTTGAAAAAAAAAGAGADDSARDDGRPRKRAIVRIPRKKVGL